MAIRGGCIFDPRDLLAISFQCSFRVEKCLEESEESEEEKDVNVHLYLSYIYDNLNANIAMVL